MNFFFYYYVFKCKYFRGKGQVLRCFIIKGDDPIEAAFRGGVKLAFNQHRNSGAGFSKLTLLRKKNYVRNNEVFIHETREDECEQIWEYFLKKYRRE